MEEYEKVYKSRRNTWEFNVTALDENFIPINLTGAIIHFGVKRNINDAIFVFNQATTGVTISVNIARAIIFIRVAASLLNIIPETYHWDIKVHFPGTPLEEYTIKRGLLVIEEAVS